MIDGKTNTDVALNYSKMIDKDQLRLQKTLHSRFLKEFIEA